ncbi:hypothetical protein HXX76_002571 [Chlamydomonas incerta]|uniref:ShKT domain-containing protein n=1 Tax=Chlamydomonas incerta TaxID=51695 RepID=A0A835TNW7_CHLIN|nr:hypothetical protein HXX76_002571 [Chlamydomonas incerta]|eukprot:KAG2442485.1 hypothetical protein HXX76_002571 [Chlamydomonas incerta]
MMTRGGGNSAGAARAVQLVLALALMCAAVGSASTVVPTVNDTPTPLPTDNTSSGLVSVPLLSTNETPSNVTSAAGRRHRRHLQSCADQRSECASWAKQGYCASKYIWDNKSVRDIVCAKSCVCTDQYSECAKWASQGYCASNYVVDKKSVRDVACPKSCNGKCSSGCGGSSGGGSSGGGSSGGGSSGGSGGGSSSGGGCPSGWSKAVGTAYDSWPKSGTSECIDYEGCKWAGQFVFGPDQSSPCRSPSQWLDGGSGIMACRYPASQVAAWKIAATYQLDASLLGRKLEVMVQGAPQRTVTVNVKDVCSDDDCDGCCKKNTGNKAWKLIDLEKGPARTLALPTEFPERL